MMRPRLLQCPDPYHVRHMLERVHIRLSDRCVARWRFSSPSSLSGLSTTSAPLHYDIIHPNETTSENSRPNVTVFLHGLLGTGRNLNTFAKKFCQATDNMGILFDLPGHGNSQHVHVHSLAACVQHVHDTILHIIQNTTFSSQGPTTDTISPPVSVIGHSFGGRVALQYAANFDQFSNSSSPSHHQINMQRLILLDTVPGPPNAIVAQTLRAADEILAQKKDDTSSSTPRSRADLVSEFAKDMELSHAQWLGSLWNTKLQTFSFHLPTAKAVLQDFAREESFMKQLQHVVTDGHPTLQRVDLVRGLKNTGWQYEAVQEKVRIMKDWEMLRTHDLPNAAHWVHADDLPGLLDALTTEQ